MRLRSGEVARCIGELRLPSGEEAMRIGESATQEAPGGGARRRPGGSRASKIAPRRLRELKREAREHNMIKNAAFPRVPGPKIKITLPREANPLFFGARGEDYASKPQNSGDQSLVT